MDFKFAIVVHRFKIRWYIKPCVSFQERDLELEMGDDYVLDLQSKYYIRISITKQ